MALTFKQLVTDVAKEVGVSEAQTRRIINSALARSAKAAFNGGAPRFKGIGQLVAVTPRLSGRRPDGTRWEAVPRKKLALRTRRIVRVDGTGTSQTATDNTF